MSGLAHHTLPPHDGRYAHTCIPACLSAMPQVRPPSVDEAWKLKPSGLLVSFVYPAQQPELLGALK